MKLVIMVSFLLLFAATAMAEENICSYLTEDLGISEGITLESYVPYKDEVFNVYTKGNEAVGHLKLENRTITSIGCSAAKNPTYNVHVKNLGTVKSIVNSENQFNEFNSQLKDDSISLEGTSAPKKMKGFFTKIGIGIASWFF